MHLPRSLVVTAESAFPFVRTEYVHRPLVVSVPHNRCLGVGLEQVVLAGNMPIQS